MSSRTGSFGNRLALSALIGLGALPLLPAIGRMVLRFVDVDAPPEMVADTARFFIMPVPVVLHVVGGCLFTLLGALQFSPALRRYPWHRLTGRVLVVAGLIAALSALWLTQFYPHPPSEGPLLYWFRLAAGSAMLAYLISGYRAARARRFDRHQASMMRAYALGLGASTQMLIGIPWLLLFGEPSPVVGDLLLGGAWLLNLAVVQWVLGRRPGQVVGPLPASA